ncbi:hypothetical protein KUCAC02_034590 [Chaenocephalus aceratus]|nr:hypothetical protein KUCAC02_034590 [Chaenocephalus aceratus]
MSPWCVPKIQCESRHDEHAAGTGELVLASESLSDGTASIGELTNLTATQRVTPSPSQLQIIKQGFLFETATLICPQHSVVDGVMDTLSNLRTEEQFGKLFKSATEKPEAAGISIPPVPQDSKGRGGCLQSTNAATERHSFQSVEDYYRGKVYYFLRN